MNAFKNIVKVMSAVLVAASVVNAGPLPSKVDSAASSKVEKKPVEKATTLTVQVIDSNNVQVEGALVMIDPEQGAPAHQEATADAKGRVSFKGLKAGRYLVCVLTPYSMEWMIVEVKAGAANEATMHMELNQ